MGNLEDQMKRIQDAANLYHRSHRRVDEVVLDEAEQNHQDFIRKKTEVLTVMGSLQQSQQRNIFTQLCSRRKPRLDGRNPIILSKNLSSLSEKELQALSASAES